MKSSGFLNDIHYFRGLSIVLIVSSHLWFIDVDSIFYQVVSAIFLNSTLFFAFISGFLFQYLLKSYQYKDYLKRKFLYVLLPYFLVSIPVILLRLKAGPSYLALLNNPDLEQYSVFKQVVYYYMTGAHQLPLWYLPMVTIFFLLAPLFAYLDRNPILYWCLPLLCLLALFLPRGDLSQLNNIPRMFGHFLFIYVFGMFVSRYKALVEQFTKRYLILLTMFLLVFFVLSVFETTHRHQIIFVQKFLAILVLLYFLQFIRDRITKVCLHQLAVTSFGIYFIHFYIIQIIRLLSLKLGFSEYPSNISMWFLELVIVMLLSFIFVFFTRLVLKKYSRYLIGS